MAQEINIKTVVDTEDAQNDVQSLSKKIDKLIETQQQSLKETKDLGDKASKSLDNAEKSTGGLAKGFKGVGLAIKAAGIGLLIGILSTVKDLLSENQKVTDLFNTAFTALSTAVNDFIEFITGGNLLEKVGNFFEALIDNPLKAIGGAIEGIKEYTVETVKAADANIKLQNSARIAAAEQGRLIEQYDRQAEQLRQIRDNEDVSIAKRLEANTKLGQLLEKQIAEETKLVEISIESARARVAENNSIDNQVALIEALTQQDALLARVTGQRSEQIVNQTSLQRELNEQLEEELRIRTKAGEFDEGKIESQGVDLTPEQELRIRQEEFMLSKLAQANEAFAVESKEISKRLSDEEIAIEQAKAEQKLSMIRMGFAIATNLARQGSQEAKAIAVAQVLFETYKGIQGAFAAATTNPVTGAFPAYPFIQAAAAASFGFANVRSILATKTSGGSPGGNQISTTAPRASIGSGGGGDSAVPNIDAINQGVGGQQNSRFNNVKAYLVQEELQDQTALNQRLNDLQKA